MLPTAETFKFAGVRERPLRAITQRIMVALLLVVITAGITYLDRSGYSDVNGHGGGLSVLDAFYYATVTVTTTGYGDVVPASESARLVTTLIITPLRVLFLILLVGTTVEVLASHTRFIYKFKRWQKRLRDHTIICGYGVKGRSALAYLCEIQEDLKENVVVIDPSKKAIDQANSTGVSGIIGSAADTATLKEAMVDKAKMIVIAPATDDATVLITLRARELNPKATIVATCREEQNVTLLKSSGADSVIVSAGAAGRLMGLAAYSAGAAEVVTDLLAFGRGLDIAERPITGDEAGMQLKREQTFLAVIRDGKLLHLNDDTGALQPGDHIVYVKDHDGPKSADKKTRIGDDTGPMAIIE